MSKNQKQYIGLDLGSSSIKLVSLNQEEDILFRKKKTHFGNVLEGTKQLLEEYSNAFPNAETKLYVTGANASVLVKQEKYIIGDIPAIEQGMKVICPDAKSVIEIGAQNARYLTNLGENQPPQFATNENCAGGTGSFFEDQMYRLGLNMEDYSAIVSEANTVPRLSGRCSVFAKTDIIHRQQEGVATPDILLGLCFATIQNLKSTIIRNLPIQRPIALCGGVTNNIGVIQAVKRIFDLEEQDFILCEENEYVQAIGAAYTAIRHGGMDLTQCNELLSHSQGERESDIRRLEPLILRKNTKLTEPECVPVNGKTRCSLGIDVGSTSTNLVVLNEAGELLDFQYLRTKGEPKETVKTGLRNLKEKYGDDLLIRSVGVTGSGRYLIGKMIGADVVHDEITAQAKAAVCAYPDADTVFEIGGQDSKYIQVKNGAVTDFQMNKICAAGTGSFIEEQANRMHVPIEEYGERALSSENPADLGERCTVFIESNIVACLSKGAKVDDVLAGLCHSVIRNYLYKVAGKKPVGKKIILQGGVCYNPAVVAAFQAFYGEKIFVSPYFSVSGAYGVARIAMEEIEDKETNFLGLNLEKKSNASIYGLKENIDKNKAFYNKAKEFLMNDYSRERVSNKKTIGIPYVLVVHKLFPMFRTYFEALGYQVLLSKETDEEIISLAQKYVQAETCYPVKLIYGHMAWLAKEKVDYMFLPSILTMKHDSSNVHHNYGCLYMQSAPKFIFDGMKLREQGIELINPLFSLDFGKKAMVSAMLDVGISLGKSKPACLKALVSGAMAVRKHTEQVEQLGNELLSGIGAEEKVLVLVTRTYGIEDPILNMGIPEELLNRGYKVITLSHLPAHDLDISGEYDNLYWPFGQHIVSGVKMIANHPNLYAVYLTNHGCGPDTMMTHFVRSEMGEKPYLQIEVDEHFSKVGVITRIEAFLNSLKMQKTTAVVTHKDYFCDLPKRAVKITGSFKEEVPLYLPNLYPYSQLISSELNRAGEKVYVLPKTNEKSLETGRSIATTKEYLSFIALAGNILEHANFQKGEMQYFVPQTEGSETDGVYARVLSEYLVNNPQSVIVTRNVETLFIESKYGNQIFLALLAGDVVLAAEPELREKILEKFMSNELSFENICEEAEKISTGADHRIFVLGEPYILYDSFLHEHLLEGMEAQGRKISWMALSEYLCFMWKKRAERKQDKKAVQQFELQMKKVSQILGKASPFSESLEGLMERSEECIRGVTGGNIAYRYAKHASVENVNAVISVSSTYENAQTILNLVAKEEIPSLSLSFEGTNDIAAKERLQSFLYYV